MHYILVFPIRRLIVSALVSISFLLALPVAAQVTVTDGNIAATFSSAPLFNAPTTANIAPVATQTGTITVVNNGANTESVLLAAVATSSTGLAEAVELVVTEGGLVRYTGTFWDFFATTSVPLSNLAPGASSTYILTANFLSGSGDQYQGITMAFDLRIGFASGAGVINSTGGGRNTTGTRINPPTAGNNNSPDGIVAGAATDNGADFDNGLWPSWETLTAAISDAVTPDRNASDRNASGASELSTSTQDTVFEQEGVADEDPKGMVAGISDKSVLLWFTLLGFLGVIGLSALQLSSSIQLKTGIDKLRPTYLLVTVGCVIALFVAYLLIGSTPL
jgi:hypothetical protein